MSRDGRRLAAVHAAALAVYVALAAICTYPLLVEGHRRIANDPGDPVLNASVLWWNATTLPFSRAWWTPPHFYPIEGVSAFTENLVGLGVVATPAYWLTGNPLVAYNLALFATWPLSAFAAYLLTFGLVRRHDAAFVAGLAFGFAPYRVTQMAHVQVLTAYWLPVALLALHRYLAGRRRPWLAVFGAAWILQALSNGYFLLFGGVLIAGWIAYFGSSRQGRGALPAIVGSWALASLPLVAVFWTYRVLHQRFGFARTVNDAIRYSAEPWAWTQVSNVVWFWGSVLGDTDPEVNLFPGVTALALVVLGVLKLTLRREPPAPEPARRRLARAALGVGVAAGLVATMTVLVGGPWRVSLAGLTLRMSDLDRSLLLIAACGIPFLWLTPRTRHALQRRSPLVFYTAATIAVVVFCMGPEVRLGRDVLLSPAPYQLLRLFPGFDGLRVPTRFWMLGALCLAVAGGVAFARLVPPRSRIRGIATVLVAAGTLLDGWMRRMPMADPPEHWPRVEHRGVSAAIIELPLGPSWDAAATYRALRHRRRVVNGVSGYDPPHYAPLQIGLNAHDRSVLLALASLGPIEAVVDSSQDPDGRIQSYVSSFPGVTRVRSDGIRTVFRLPDVDRVERRPGPELRVVSARASDTSHDLAAALDRDRATRWLVEPQRPGQWAEVDFGAVQPVALVELWLGRAVFDYPRHLVIALSRDAVEWTNVWEGSTVGEAVLAAIRSPLEVPLRFAFEPQPARFLRLSQTSDAGGTWTIAELRVFGAGD